MRNICPFREDEDAESATNPMVEADSAWGYSHLVLGALGLFVYVGAEVSIGSFLVNFFFHQDIAGLGEAQAAKYVSFYSGGAMVGRFMSDLGRAPYPGNARPRTI